MTQFMLLPPEGRRTLAGLVFLAAMAQLGLCLYQTLCRAQPRRRAANAALFLALLLLLAYVNAGVAEAQYPAAFPWLLLPLLFSSELAYAAWAIRREYRRSRETLSPDSVKQTLDRLNAGVAFADFGGRVILMNNALGKLSAALIGGNPRMLGELLSALSAPPPASGVTRRGESPVLFRFPDGRIWQFQTVPLAQPGLEGYVQMTAQDLTELAEVNEQLARDNEALRVAIAKMRGMVERMADLIPAQEALSLKIRVHNEIGASLIALSELAHGGAGEETDAQIRALSNALRFFGSTGYAAPGTFADACAQAREMHAELIFTGDMPRSRASESLIAAAARECVTNCVRHAHGKRVNVYITDRNGLLTVLVTNDGNAPEGPIREGGGLSSLRKKVESVGGEMYISTFPRMTLILNFKEGDAEA